MSDTLNVVHARVLDPASGTVTETSLHLAGGRVAVAGSDLPPADRTLDVGGAVVVPGLIDAHFHAYAVGVDPARIEALPMSYVAHGAARRLRAALGRGFTTVRDVAGGDAGLARAIDEGLLVAPRYLHSGPALSQTGGHGDVRTALDTGCACAGIMTEVVDGVDALRRAVRERVRGGAHVIKVMTSGGVVSPVDPIRVPQYSAEEVRAVTTEASRHGRYVAAHAYSPEAIVHSIDNGVRSIEHGNLLDEPTAVRMRDAGAFLVPTLAAYEALDRRGAEVGLSSVGLAKNREVLEHGRRALELAARAGVAIGFGTDLMGDLEDEQSLGLRAQVEVLGALEALRTATVGNAALLGREELGHLGVGAAADLVVLAGDPLEDPAVLWEDRGRPRTVVSAGRVIAG